MNLLNLIVGFVLLIFGRKFYWLFVVVVGFITGYILGGQFFPQPSIIIQVIIGLLAGAAGAVLLFFLHQFTIGLAGFIGGGLLSLQILDLSNLVIGNLEWLLFLIGGIIGTILVSLIYDWALILLSSLAGAFLIASGFTEAIDWSNLIVLAFFIIGLFVQAAQFRKERAKVINT